MAFSGKKKKAQLQAKRQRKRDAEERQNEDDRLENQIREALVAAGEAVTDEAIEERKDAHYRARGGGNERAPHGRKEHRRRWRKEQQQQQQEGEGKGGGRRGSRGGAAAGDGNDDDDESDVEYRYDAHGHGIRSAFRRENKAELAARRRLNYLPLANRQFMDGKVGIPFGRWFVMPRRVGDGVEEHAIADGDARDNRKEGEGAEADGSGSVQRPVVAADGSGSSACFPFSVAIPSRGWVAGGAAEADKKSGAEGVRTLSSELCVAATEEKGKNTPSSSSSSSSGSGSSDDESGGAETENDGEGSKSSAASDGDGAAAAKDPALALRRHVEAVEEARFRRYLDVVEHYPLPGPTAGLVAGSCERNIDVWRQLWRTVEASDVNVVVADARYPIVHAHLGLLTYLTKHECRPCVLVLNKVDLVPQPVLETWLRFIPRFLEEAAGLTVMPSDDAAAFMAANTPAALRARRGTAPIVLTTFTADPSTGTAHGGGGDDVTVNRRRRAKQRRGKMYEQLRAGQLNVARDLARGGDGADDDDDDVMMSDDETAYDATTNFKGMAKAERAMQAGKRGFEELRIVADMISGLLATCRALAPAKDGLAAGARATAEGKEKKEKIKDDDDDDDDDGEQQKRTPVVAPMRRAPKRRNRKKGRRGLRNTSTLNESGSSDMDGDGNSSDDDDDENNPYDSADEDVLETRERDDADYVHIGFIGYPNVGKSSLLNCIRGTKVVSVSATPGHTKHLQTIPIAREGVTLIDSPGLVAPYYGLPRPLEAVLGTHQIAQTRDPQSGIAFLASHLPLERIYGLRRPDDADEDDEWSAHELCEAYAKKRGYYVRHGRGAVDVHRAAIAMLQEAYQGRLVLYFAPPELNYLQSRHFKEKVQPHLLLRVFKEEAA